MGVEPTPKIEVKNRIYHKKTLPLDQPNRRVLCHMNRHSMVTGLSRLVNSKRPVWLLFLTGQAFGIYTCTCLQPQPSHRVSWSPTPRPSVMAPIMLRIHGKNCRNGLSCSKLAQAGC